MVTLTLGERHYYYHQGHSDRKMMIVIVRAGPYIISRVLCSLQACDSIILGKYPAPDTTLHLLAALRLQFNEGDYKPGDWV